MYKVTITTRAEKELKKLDRHVKNRVVKEILSLSDDARPSGCKKVQSEEGVWRIRVGDWRVGYMIDDSRKEVTVIRIGHRSEFYD
jgi:mRNA interferase RelE/StbE